MLISTRTKKNPLDYLVNYSTFFQLADYPSILYYKIKYHKIKYHKVNFILYHFLFVMYNNGKRRGIYTI